MPKQSDDLSLENEPSRFHGEEQSVGGGRVQPGAGAPALPLKSLGKGALVHDPEPTAPDHLPVICVSWATPCEQSVCAPRDPPFRWTPVDGFPSACCMFAASLGPYWISPPGPLFPRRARRRSTVTLKPSAHFTTRECFSLGDSTTIDSTSSSRFTARSAVSLL
jgi:hypothetical protein